MNFTFFTSICSPVTQIQYQHTFFTLALQSGDDNDRIESIDLIAQEEVNLSTQLIGQFIILKFQYKRNSYLLNKK